MMNQIVFKAAMSRLIVVVDSRTGAILRLADTHNPKSMIHFNGATEAFFVIDPKDVEIKNAI